MVRPVCILDLDSPSYPPERDEYRQCGCRDCIRYLTQHKSDSDVLMDSVDEIPDDEEP
jgi:hypothetical protein